MNQTVAEGEPLLLVCRVQGLPLPQVLLMGSDSSGFLESAPGVSYINKTAEVEDAGLYYCIVGSSQGTIQGPTAMVGIICELL